MTSLADAYEGRVGVEVSRRRLFLGLGLFVSGALLTAVGVVVASTDLLTSLGLVSDRMAAWRRAGVLAGLGVPAVIAGVFTVLPSGRRVKAASTIGASVSVLGVALFWYAYPAHWAGYGQQLTLPVTGVYFFGVTASVWSLFVGIANFKRRNAPGGTVTLQVTKGGETKVVEVARSELRSKGVGGVGVFGGGPDGDVETQTGPGAAETSTTSTDGSTVTRANRGGESASTAAQATTSADPGGPTGGAGGERARTASAGAASDGGLEDDEIRSLSGDGELVGAGESARDLADRYCGNCEHFRYVRSEDGMRPYCGFHGEAMDDMEACEEWEPNH
jgi:hypothetical protein